MNEATTQPRSRVPFVVLVLLVLGGGPACEFNDGTPIRASEDGGVEDDVGEEDVVPSEDVATDHGSDTDGDADGDGEAEADAEVEPETEVAEEGGAP